MTALVVAPVIPPVAHAAPAARPDGQGETGARKRRASFPLATLTAVRERGTVYGLAAVDGRGRIADHQVMTALGWLPGTRLDVRECEGLVLVSVNRHGVFALTSQGHLRLPATVRHWCRLAPGQRARAIGVHDP